jgi:hypothetical protein
MHTNNKNHVTSSRCTNDADQHLYHERVMQRMFLHVLEDTNYLLSELSHFIG